MHRIWVFIARVFSVLAAMALVGFAAPGLAAATGPQAPYGQAKIINTDRIVGFPQRTMLSRPASQNGPAATVTPTSETVASGATASFTRVGVGLLGVFGRTPRTAAARGSTSPTGHQADGSTVTGATTTALTITNVQADENKNEYEASFLGFGSLTTTNPATLTVTSSGPTKPTVTTSPSNASASVGGQASFSSAASGNPAPTVLWQVLPNGSSVWANLSNGPQTDDNSTVSGATTTTLVINNAQADENNNQYRAAFNNSQGTTNSNGATLMVTSPPPLTKPTVTTSPSHASTSVGGQASFNSAASGNPAPTVQWQVLSERRHGVGQPLQREPDRQLDRERGPPPPRS